MNVNRRKFLVRTGRAAVFGTLSLLMFRLFRRNPIVSRERCVNGGICSGCTNLSGCILPPALSRRSAEKGNR